jgi:8-oxo-dGTP diphosphatase
LSYRDAEKEYQKCVETRIGKLIAARELPVLRRVKVLLGE